PPPRFIANAHPTHRAATIDVNIATPNDTLAIEPVALASESYNTTHYSIVDQDGNRVRGPLRINSWFGAGVVAGDTGVLLNNEIHEFSLSSTIANNYLLL